MPGRCDVAVLGGGPAGTATALALKRRHPELAVAVLERTAYEAERIGETLHPGVEPLLRELGAWDELAAGGLTPAYGTRALWGGDEPVENEFLFHRNGRGWHLDRARFDAALARLAAARGVDLRLRAHPLAAHREDGRWHLTLRDSRLAARFVVDATGRAAAFARAQGARKIRFDRLLGVGGIVELPPGAPVDTYTLVESWQDGWWYSAPLPQGESASTRMILLCMTDPDVLHRRRLRDPIAWRAEADRAGHTARRLAGAALKGPLAVHAAASHRLDRATGDGWLAAGDAALAIDPLSSGGIFQALRSGLFAARAVADALAGDSTGLAKVESFLAAQCDEYLATRALYYGRERRWGASAFWRRRHEAITLDPRQRLRFAGDGVPATGLHLPPVDLRRLCELCRDPRPAAELAAALKAQSPAPASDLRIVLALQDLVERGVLAAADGPRDP